MEGGSHRNTADSHSPHVIVVGNEKGGSGKTTTAIHIAVALLRQGHRVGSVDLDSRQASFTRFIENRLKYAEAAGLELPTPLHRRLRLPDQRTDADAFAGSQFRLVLSGFPSLDFIVIDTPGTDSPLSRLGHEYADTLVTPLNDSFLDLDVLAQIDQGNRAVLAPSTYCRMVWEYHNRRIIKGLSPIDWIVMRNRLAHIDARNKRDIARLLEILSGRIGFRIAPGFGERVIFRELFPMGMTLLDLPTDEPETAISHSRLAARREVMDLLDVIGLAGADTG